MNLSNRGVESVAALAGNGHFRAFREEVREMGANAINRALMEVSPEKLWYAKALRDLSVVLDAVSIPDRSGKPSVPKPNDTVVERRAMELTADERFIIEQQRKLASAPLSGPPGSLPMSQHASTLSPGQSYTPSMPESVDTPSIERVNAESLLADGIDEDEFIGEVKPAAPPAALIRRHGSRQRGV